MGGDAKEDKRKEDMEKTDLPTQKRLKMSPLVDWGEVEASPAPCVRTWLLEKTVPEDEIGTNWRERTPMDTQTPSTKLKQLELNFAQTARGVDMGVDSAWNLSRPRTCKLSKKEIKTLAKTNRKIDWKIAGSSKEYMDPVTDGEAGEDSMEAVEDHLHGQEDQEAAKLTVLVDQQEEIENYEGTPGGKSLSVNKLIKTYKKSKIATKKINKIKNKIKNNKTKKEKNEKNKLIGHPDGEKRTNVPNMEGPDVLCAWGQEEDTDHHQGGQFNNEDQRELTAYMEDWGIKVVHARVWDLGWEAASNMEMDRWYTSIRGTEIEEGTWEPSSMMEEDEEDWPAEAEEREQDEGATTYEEWVNSVLAEMNFPQESLLTSNNCALSLTESVGRGKNMKNMDNDRVQNTHTAQNTSRTETVPQSALLTSINCAHNPTELVGSGENKDNDGVRTVHIVQNVSLPTVRKVRKGGTIEQCQAQEKYSTEFGLCSLDKAHGRAGRCLEVDDHEGDDRVGPDHDGDGVRDDGDEAVRVHHLRGGQQEECEHGDQEGPDVRASSQGGDGDGQGGEGRGERVGESEEPVKQASRPVKWKVVRRKRGVIPDGLVQTQIQNFIVKFSNLGQGECNDNIVTNNINKINNLTASCQEGFDNDNYYLGGKRSISCLENNENGGQAKRHKQ